MEEQKPKSFWKRYDYFVIIAATLVFIYLLVYFNQKINFLLGNELIILLEPQQKSVNLHFGDTVQSEFNIETENVAYCRSACTYSFNDRSLNSTIDHGDFDIEINNHVIKSYNLSVKRLGSGQDIYSFDVSCHSIRSFFCLTKSSETSRSSLVIVNYDLTEAEKKLKEGLKKDVITLLEYLSEADVAHQRISQKYFELGFKANLQNLTKQKIEIDDKYDKIRVSVENLRSLWSIENYEELNKRFNQSFFDGLAEIKFLIFVLDKSVDDTVKLHNAIVGTLNGISGNLSLLEGFNSETLQNESQTALAIDEFNNLSQSIKDNNFESYAGLENDIATLKEKEKIALEKSKILAVGAFFRSLYYQRYAADLLCMLNQDCNRNLSIISEIESTRNFMERYPDIELARQGCESLKAAIRDFALARNQSSAAISMGGIPSGDDFTKKADDFMEDVKRRINNSYLESLGSINNSNLSEIAQEVLPARKTDLALASNWSANTTLYLLSRVDAPSQAYDSIKECSRLNYSPEKVANVPMPITVNLTYNITSKINTSLPENPPVCCVFGDCSPCCLEDSCKNDPKTFPVVFVHGHSFAKGNSPEFSLDTFNKLQSGLEDEGYLNAGIVSLYSKNEPAQSGIWSLSGKPITVKVSYYYDAFRKDDKYIVFPTKSENIDTYTLRLRDLIEIVKGRTGKPKVNIIAHSMGGLIARRYVQIFGSDDINKMVLIATPNGGISGKAASYCGYLGENRECQDMLKDGPFINKLNDPLNPPNMPNVYNIIGVGCQTDSSDGDGVVTSESAKLKNATTYFVNGTCGGIFGSLLHTDILNIEMYPETYNTIKKILISG